MGKINSITKQTDNRYVNLYNVKATSVHNTPVNYFVSSRAKDVDSLKMVTHKNNPDGVIIYSIYGERHEKVVLIRQYRYTLGDYIYEFPAGLVEPDENYHEGAIREMYEETGLKLDPIPVAEAYQKPYFTTVGMTDESCATVYGYASGEISSKAQEDTEEIEVIHSIQYPDRKYRMSCLHYRNRYQSHPLYNQGLRCLLFRSPLKDPLYNQEYRYYR